MRVDYFTVAPGVARAMMGLEGYLHKEATGDDKLPKRLLELVKIRASGIHPSIFFMYIPSPDHACMAANY